MDAMLRPTTDYELVLIPSHLYGVRVNIADKGWKKLGTRVVRDRYFIVFGQLRTPAMGQEVQA